MTAPTQSTERGPAGGGRTPRQRVPRAASDGRPVDITINPGYTLIIAGGQFRVRPELTLFLRIDNLPDAVYDSALGHPGLPRAFLAGGRFDIGG